MLIIMLIISGPNQRTFKQLKRVADYYADNQRRNFLTSTLQLMSVQRSSVNGRKLKAKSRSLRLLAVEMKELKIDRANVLIDCESRMEGIRKQVGKVMKFFNLSTDFTRFCC